MDTLVGVSPPAVRPEFGPSLPALLAPLPRRVRVALAVAALLVVVALIAQGARPSGSVQRVVVSEGPVAFNVARPTVLERAAAGPGESLRLATGPGAEVPQSASVSPLALPAYRGDPVAALMVQAGRRATDLARTVPGFVLRGEGRTRVNEQPGYQLQFQFTMGGRTAYGRSVLLVPAEEVDPAPRRGVVLELRTARSGAVARYDVVGNGGALKTVLRSFRFGSDAPDA